MTRAARRPLVIFGGGGHARALADVVVRAGTTIAAVSDPARPWETIRWFDEDAGAISFAVEHDLRVAVALGDNQLRLELLLQLIDNGLQAVPIVALTATVSPDATLGPGTVVFEHAHIGPGAMVGAACIVNTAAVVEHDARLDDGVHVGPRSTLAGAARCDTFVALGAGAVVLPGIRVGERAYVGAGAVVTTAVPPGSVVGGVPARPLGVRDPAP